MGRTLFRIVWRGVNVALLCALVALAYSGAWEYSVRRYLSGFTDAIIPANATPEQRVQAILGWMRNGPPRAPGPIPESASGRDPQTTLNYKQLLSVCGTATNAFLNLARTSGLPVRRLLLLTPQRTAKHVVAEVLLDGRWIVVDPTYRAILTDSHGKMLTRKELQDPRTFAEAASQITDYPVIYNYEKFAHVRVARLPLDGMRLRTVLDGIYPGWEEAFDWSLLLERESFFTLSMAGLATVLLLMLRVTLGWYADRRLLLPRFHLREHLMRAGAAFFTTPEIK